MNRIVLIGNGFDLAHGLKTSYQDFINWYWEQRVHAIWSDSIAVSKDCLCELRIKGGNGIDTFFAFFWSNQVKLGNMDGCSIIRYMRETGVLDIKYVPFFENITKSIETKGWVDIENEYYALLKQYAFGSPLVGSIEELNGQLKKIQELLVEYLNRLKYTIEPKKELRRTIYAPIQEREVSTKGLASYYEYINSWLNIDENPFYEHIDNYNPIYGFRWDSVNRIRKDIMDEIKEENIDPNDNEKIAHRVIDCRQLDSAYLPQNVLLVNFNYTPVAKQYFIEPQNNFQYVNIHGNIEHSESVIFGYGDDLDDRYKDIQNKNDKEYLKYIKSFHYSESDNYRRILQFADADNFQIYIMGHSCGNSDRTLLNTLFEHKNCVSIKPFYHIDKDGKDNYMEIVQNIARNFTDMKLMRDRVVNKTYTEAFSDDRN